MARLFSNEFNSNKTRNQVSKIEPKKLLFIAFEGSVTEPKYFLSINQILKDSPNYSVKIYPIIRFRRDGLSHPKHVRDGIIEYFEEKIKSNFDKKRDELWIVIDIDHHFKGIKGKSEESAYNEYLESLNTKNGIAIKPAISNPSFELWLLLHFVRAEELNLSLIKKNERISNKYTYIKKQLVDIINNKSDPPQLIYNEYYKLTQTAIQNSKSHLLCHENIDLLNHVGTSVFNLMNCIFK